ncbi:hypothetical protein [Aquipuribacter sp. SD81]|uniref:hypothetical protein n=1 Tax=Aquipuribacter sp. SD81 TaxID=3127703 RepID=UPI003016DCE1
MPHPSRDAIGAAAREAYASWSGRRRGPNGRDEVEGRVFALHGSDRAVCAALARARRARLEHDTNTALARRVLADLEAAPTSHTEGA